RIVDANCRISPRWNQIALEHLNVSHHLPVIKMFSIREILPARFGWSLYIRIPRHYSTYFGVDRWDIITEFSDGVRETSGEERFALISRLF
ncbi:hypothetical protein PENTCL1PPCAC_30384, partial [Pristionchus entomophagus]